MSGRKLYIHTFGCQMNVYDSEYIRSLLTGIGFEPTDSPSEADLLLINTCSVREKAERREMERVRELAVFKRRRPGSVLGVVGCMAQRMSEELAAMGDRVDLVVGTDCYQELPQMVERALSGSACQVSTARRPEVIYRPATAATRVRLRSPVSIMRGCDLHCAYCVVPSARGRERSKPWGEVLREVDDLIAHGTREVTLLGQNVNGYRDGERGLAELLRELGRREALWRIRFTTSHPHYLSDEIIDAVAAVPAACEQLHLPLQAGSDRVLAAMGRRYTAEEYLGRLRAARQAISDLWLSTDLMVGFPGETEADFQRTLEMVAESRFDAAFTFKYSPRPGTRALNMPDQVPEEVRGERLQRLVDLTNRLADTSSRRLLDHVWEVLVDETDPRHPGHLRGLTRGNRIVVFPGSEESIGGLVPVRVHRVSRWHAEGESVLPRSSRSSS